MAKDLTKVQFGREREIAHEIGKGLEDSLKDAKKIDYHIARSLQSGLGIIGYVGRIPGIGRLVTKVRAIKPLPHLESALRTALTSSLLSLVKVGKKADEEKERIAQLEEMYETAIADEWGPQEFINYMEANTDIDYIVSLDEEEIDMKELFKVVDSRLSPERKEEKKQEYLDWLKQHINLSKQYLESMNALCFVGCEWIGGMSRSYFDLTQLRSGMEEIQKTLQNLGGGKTASITSQQALRQYGTAYIKGMRSLIKGYRSMCALKDTGSDEFAASLKQLEADLNDTKAIEHSSDVPKRKLL